VKRTTWNFVLDSISLVNLLLLAGTGSIMRWVLPPGSGGGRGYGFRGGRGPGPGGEQVKQLLGLGRHDWGDIHFALVLVHLALHWTWIKTCGKTLLLPSRKKMQPPCP
jgi:hypothetical protein